MPLNNELPEYESLINPERPEETEHRLHAYIAQMKDSGKADYSQLIVVLTQLAAAQGQQGRLEESRKTLKQAEDLLTESEGGYRVVAKIRYLLEMGKLYQLEKTPSQARPLFIEAWNLASNSGEDFFAIDAARMLAAIEPQKVQKEWLAKALALAERSPQNRAHQWQGPLYMTAGWAQFEVRQFESALEYFKNALRSLKVHGSPKKIILAKWAVGRTLRALNRLPEALEIQQDLLAELSLSHYKDGHVYEELAECLHSLKRSDEAQVYFELAYGELSKDEWQKNNKPAQLKRMKELGKVKGAG